MIFNIKVNLEGIPESRSRGDKERVFDEDPNLQFIVVPSSYHTDDPVLCIRGVGNFTVTKYDKRAGTGIFLYDDFKVGATPEDRPEWFWSMKDRILETSASEEYGSRQNLQVQESIIYRSAEARIRFVGSIFARSGIVFLVKILAEGKESFEDALQLHAKILSGEAYIL